ncbi:hypothetical protein [Halococcoides cellulosivorans]|uniref:Uncharacterized protein n=1 Tax=Halococcoides cellulosivorans TaxID=1679096 RepID=A0A2R4WXT3_9EURY|nr:hypothetical protein [Halococcoides cellulosivorans]AWB26353.1 hypothetical protein HARCEL1_00765 [Halococcoides cellulosivorans]
MDVFPEDRPIAEAIETPPRFGIYADDVLADLGGIEGLFDHKPWYVAHLDDHHTLVIEAESPWGDWQPPTEAPYIQSARFGEGATESDRTDLSDPFAALDPGEYGTEVCVDPDDVDAGFRDADLELVRVYVDEDRNLRRVEDDRFVRSVITDGPDDNVAFVDAMLTEAPTDAPPSTPRASALLNDAISPAFVRAATPDDETVVSRVLALPVETNKIELLVSLGRAYRQSDEMDVETVESALDELANVDDPRQVEQFIETRLV